MSNLYLYNGKNWQEIARDGETPILGVDYWTPEDKNKVIKEVLSKVPKPKDGIDGKDGLEVSDKKLKTFNDEIISTVNKKIQSLDVHRVLGIKQNGQRIGQANEINFIGATVRENGEQGVDVTITGGAGGGVTSIIAGTNVTISPTNGLGDVTINATGGGGAVDSVNSKTGTVVLNQDDIGDGTTYKQYSATEKTKLAGIATGAEVNVNADWNAVSGDAQILNKPTIPTTLASLTDDATHRIVTDTEKTTWNAKQPAGTYSTDIHANITALNAVSGSNTGDETTATIKTKLSITTLSGSNTGDQDLSGLVPKTTTVNTKALSGNIVLTPDDLDDTSTTHKFVAATDITNWNAKQAALGFTPENITNKENTTMDTSTTKYPTNNLVKTYVDSMVAGLLDYRGAYDASGNVYPSTGGSGTGGAVMKGDMWVVSVAGTLNSKTVHIGDYIIALVDTPAQTNANWNTLDTNLGYTPENQANKVTAFSTPTDVQYPSAKLVSDQLALKQNTITNPITGTGTTNELSYWSSSSTQSTLPASSYPSLTEIAYVKGVTSAIQTQLGSKLPLAGGNMTGSINEAKGADIASATTTDIGAATGNYLNITGTTTITGLGTVQAGTRRIVTFTGALILTHNGTSLILPTSANITTVAGDSAIFESLGSGNWKCVSYQRQDGSALLSAGSSDNSFGNGSDGDVTISTNTTLSRDMFYKNLTINSSIILSTAGFKIYVSGTLLNNGTISGNGLAGGNSSSQTGGIAGAGTNGGTAGQTGANGSNSGGNATLGINGTSVNPSLGVNGVKGGFGNGGGGADSVGGTATAETVIIKGGITSANLSNGSEITTPTYLVAYGSVSGLTLSKSAGSGSGGGGAGYGGVYGGGGGGSGCSGATLPIFASTLTNNGTISSNGGNGGNGYDHGSNNIGGGGGGGSGGVIILVYKTLTAGTITVTGGNGGGPYAYGANGNTGVIFKCKII